MEIEVDNAIWEIQVLSHVRKDTCMTVFCISDPFPVLGYTVIGINELG